MYHNCGGRRDLEHHTRNNVGRTYHGGRKADAKGGPPVGESAADGHFVGFNGTLLLKYDHDWGMMTPEDPVEAREITQSHNISNMKACAHADDLASKMGGSTIGERTATPN